MTDDPAPRLASDAPARGATRILDRLHLWLAVLVIWLLATSPWVSMLRRIPPRPGFLDYAHVGLGMAALVVAVVYTTGCCRNGGWRLYFPWLAGEGAAIFRDLKGLIRGRIPGADGGGLFGAIEGFTLVALLVVAGTGAAWLWSGGTADALAWREHHILASRVLIGLVVLHAVSVSLHVLDFLTD